MAELNGATAGQAVWPHLSIEARVTVVTEGKRRDGAAVRSVSPQLATGKARGPRRTQAQGHRGFQRDRRSSSSPRSCRKIMTTLSPSPSPHRIRRSFPPTLFPARQSFALKRRSTGRLLARNKRCDSEGDDDVRTSFDDCDRSSCGSCELQGYSGFLFSLAPSGRSIEAGSTGPQEPAFDCQRR
jgi:hypothetical protein